MAEQAGNRIGGLELYRRLAAVSVARACGFAGLATLCVMVGLASEVANSLKAGGCCALLTSVVLLIKARRAPYRPVKRTELWVMLEKSERPPDAVAQGMLGNLLKSVYLKFASIHAVGAAFLLALALASRLIEVLVGA
jgi:hypothetical protein